MENGLAHEAASVETIQQASGCRTITTAEAIREAFTRCAIKKLVLISPYVQATNQHEVGYLSEAIEQLERRLGKPVVSSNQATLWACLMRLGIAHQDKRLGRLFSQS